MILALSRRCLVALLALGIFSSAQIASAVIRDGGIDPANLGKGEWIYSMKDATNRLGGHIDSVTNEVSLFQYYKSIGVRYVIIKMGTSADFYGGCYASPHQVTPKLCEIARQCGVWVFGYTRSYGEDIVGESALVDSVFNNGADGFVFDAEAEWESSRPWIGTNGPALAWNMLSMVRSNWPTKFIAHAPFPIIYFHFSFPYKEFGYFCDAVMPQVYHLSSSGLRGSPSAVMNWTDVNYRTWQDSLIGTSNIINGEVIYWTNSIKPITPLQDVYGEPGNAVGRCNGTTGPVPDNDVLEFIDYAAADPNTVTAGGYKGVNFWRADLHGTNQFAYIAAGTSGDFSNIVNNIVIDDANAAAFGGWTPIKVFAATTTSPTYHGATGTDINPFGTNYWAKAGGDGQAYMQFSPNIVTAGDYDVYQWHPTRADAASAVPIYISTSTGQETVLMNQQTNGGTWTLLGRFNFAAGPNTIRIGDNFSEPGKVAMVDGLKMVYVPIIPAAPTNLVATAISSSQIDLHWTDLSTNELSFIIARGTNSGGPYFDVGLVPANVTNFTDSGLIDGTTQYYVVRARALNSDSANSAEAFAATPPGKPIIITQPANQTAVEGQSATFTVGAASSLPIAYQWQFNHADIAGATNSSYTLSNITATADAGEYSVVVGNQLGSTSSAPAFLIVKLFLNVVANPPGGGTISISPNQSGFTSLETANLVATANPNFIFVGWSGDTAVDTTNSIYVAMTRSKTVVANFLNTDDIIVDNPDAIYDGVWTVGNAAPDKYGDYYQYAGTVAGGQSATATYAPNIVTPGKYSVSVWYPQGTNRTSHAPVQISFNGESLSTELDQTVGGGAWQLIAVGKDFAAGTGGFVEIGNTTGENNKIVVADAVRFSYDPAPVIFSQPQSQTVMLSSNATFQILAASTTPLMYQWRFVGEDIPGATGSSYTRTNVQPGDAGDYAVVLANQVEAYVSDSAELKVATVVPATLNSVSVLPDGGFHFTLNGGNNVTYTIETSTNLVDWVAITNIYSADGTLEFTGPTANDSQRFYRTRWTP